MTITLVHVVSVIIGLGATLIGGLCVGPLLKQLRRRIIIPPISSDPDIEANWSALREHPEPSGSWIGFFERVILFCALYAGEWRAAGLWVAFKTAAKWESRSHVGYVPENPTSGENVGPLMWAIARRKWAAQEYATFAVGTAANLLLAGGGAYIAHQTLGLPGSALNLESYSMAHLGDASTPFLSWLHHWQELVAAAIGAVALTLTVWWTLSAERRRRKAEAAALRVALGSEIRQLAAAVLGSYQAIAGELASVPSTAPAIANLTAAKMADRCRLPDPIVYPRGADKLGSIGEEPAFKVVYFYGQLSKLKDAVRRTDEGDEPDRPLFHREAVGVAAALLTAAQAAIDALAAFRAPTWADKDALLASRVAEAREAFRVQQQADA